MLGASAGSALAGVDAAARQRAELEVLTQELSELELELATAHAEIADFTRRYHALVGTRMATLDDLRAEVAARRAAADAADTAACEAAAAARERADRTRRESSRFEGIARETPRPFAPSGDLKKLFRRLAQKIHPDRADNESDRAWRTQLMTEANRAYQAGDQAGLLEVLALWEEGTESRAGREADGDMLSAQLARLKKRIAEIEAELNRLFGSRLYELFTATNIARRTKRDLLQEMADRLDADIAAVRSQPG
jgi:multidrug efflux pump subunit AcrA (membrane-fusion protein)